MKNNRSLYTFLLWPIVCIGMALSSPGYAQNYTGVWWQATRSGQGIQLLHQGHSISGAWYLYDQTGDDMWVTFVGTVDQNQLTAPAYRFTGPALGAAWNNTTVESRHVGTIVIDFLASDLATLQYDIESVTGVLALEPFDPNADGQFTGVWWDESKAGQGLQILHSGNAVSGAWYLYDKLGRDTWVTFVGTIANRSLDARLFRFDGSGLGGAWDPSLIQGRDVGPVRLVFANDSTIDMNYTLDAVSGALHLTQFTNNSAPDLGHFTVVWQDDYDENGAYQILGRGLDSQANEVFPDTTINSIATGQQRAPVLAVARDGSSVVVWEDDQDSDGENEIMARGLYADGSARFADIVINSTSAGQQRRPDVAIAADGRFVVVWDDDQDGNGYSQILARGFYADGRERFAEVTVNVEASGQQINPTIGMADDGRFIVAWQDDLDENGVFQILARGFHPNGSERFAAMTVNSIAAGQQLMPDLAAAADGRFTVAWADDQDQNGAYQILARGFNADGTQRFADITVNSNAAGQQLDPAIAAADDASVIVVWEDDNDSNNQFDVLARAIGADGTPRFNDITVNSVQSGQQLNPAVAVTGSGNFVVVWMDDADGNDFFQILARGFNASGVEAFPDTTVNTESAGQQLYPAVGIH